MTSIQWRGSQWKRGARGEKFLVEAKGRRKIACRATVPLGFLDEGTWQWPERNDFSASDLWQGELLSSYISTSPPPRVLFSLFRPIGLLFHRQDSLAKLLIEIWAIFQMVPFFVEKLSGQLSEEREGSLYENGNWDAPSPFYLSTSCPSSASFNFHRPEEIVSIDYSSRKIRLRHSTFFSLAKNTFLEKYLIST